LVLPYSVKKKERKKRKNTLAFIYGGTCQQNLSIKGIGLVSEPRDLPSTVWAGLRRAFFSSSASLSLFFF
jgi:hypothetical protein